MQRADTRPRRSLFRWHRTLGALAALFVLVLAGTGLALNHTDALQLDRHHLTSAWLLDWYGVAPPPLQRAYRAGDHWISQWGGRVYFDAQPLDAQGTLHGAVSVHGIVALGIGSRVLLLTDAGELVEGLGTAEGVPGSIERVGLSGRDRLVLRSAGDDYRADPDLLRFTRTAVAADWAQPAPLPDALRERIAAGFRGEGLRLERVLLDIHSGRILGRFGPFLMDAAALALVFLGTSGVWMWARHALRRRRRR